MARKATPKKSPPKVHRLSPKACVDIDALVQHVHLDKEYVILEKDGIPVVGVMDIQEFEDYLERQDPKVREHIRKSSEEYLAGKSRPARELLAELQTGKRGKTTRRQAP